MREVSLHRSALRGAHEIAARAELRRGPGCDFVQMHRVIWRPRSNGSIEERCETSADDGQSWRQHFSGVLERIAE